MPSPPPSRPSPAQSPSPWPPCPTRPWPPGRPTFATSAPGYPRSRAARGGARPARRARPAPPGPPPPPAGLPPGTLLGIALEGGSPVSHAAILARGLGIPAVVAIRGLVAAADAAEAAREAGAGE